MKCGASLSRLSHTARPKGCGPHCLTSSAFLSHPSHHSLSQVLAGAPHVLPLTPLVSRSPPVDWFQLTCSVSQPTLTAQPFPCDSFQAGSLQGFAQPLCTIPPVSMYIHSMFITSLSTSHQLSTPRCRAMLMAIQVLLRCMLLQCMYLCHLMHI